MRSIRLIVAAFATYPVEELAAECEVGNKIYFDKTILAGIATYSSETRTIVHCLEIVHQRENILVA